MMRRVMRKLRDLKKKIAERHKNKPEENEPLIEKRIRKRIIRAEDPITKILFWGFHGSHFNAPLPCANNAYQFL
jgi:hypothetical protein